MAGMPAARPARIMSLMVSMVKQECSMSMKKKSKPAWAKRRAMPGLRISETMGPKTTLPCFRACFIRFLKIM
jgi:hypothetical protein